MGNLRCNGSVKSLIRSCAWVSSYLLEGEKLTLDFRSLVVFKNYTDFFHLKLYEEELPWGTD